MHRAKTECLNHTLFYVKLLRYPCNILSVHFWKSVNSKCTNFPLAYNMLNCSSICKYPVSVYCVQLEESTSFKLEWNSSSARFAHSRILFLIYYTCFHTTWWQYKDKILKHIRDINCAFRIVHSSWNDVDSVFNCSRIFSCCVEHFQADILLFRVYIGYAQGISWSMPLEPLAIPRFFLPTGSR